MKCLLPSLLFILFSTSQIISQSNLSGIVVSQNGQAIEFASVSIFALNDTTRIRAIITDQNGRFSIPNLMHTRYQLNIQMLGLEDWSKEITVTEDLLIDTISLVEQSELLSEIQIVATQSTIETHLGKKVLRIGKDISSIGSSALEAIQAIPSVTTTPRGGIQVRGNSNVIIYINGKETKRDPASLKYIAAESIQKIEVITNPSAEHDAEGIGGIINLVYHPHMNNAVKVDVISNLALLTSPLNNNPNGGLNMSWTKNKLSLFTNLNYDYGKYTDLITSKRINYQDTLESFENILSQNGLGKITNVLVGFSFEPDTTSSFGLEASFVRWDLCNDIIQQNTFNYRSSGTHHLYSNNNREEVENELWVSISYEKEFKQKKAIKFSLTTGGEDEINGTRNDDINNMGLPIKIDHFVRSSDEKESQRYYHGTIDFEMPLKNWGTIKAGSKLDIVRYNIFQKVQLQSNNISIPNNDFEMNMSKLSAFIIQKRALKTFEYAIGVRLEHFMSEAVQYSNQETFTQNYARLFPSFQLLYRLNDQGQTLGLNYTRRINRPGFFELNPYVSYEDPLNLETGNPALEPEIADLFESNYSNAWGKLDMDLTFYYRKTGGSIQDVIRSIDVSRTLATSVNIGSTQSKGIELHLEYRPNQSFKTFGTFVLSKHNFTDSSNEITFNNQTSWNMRLQQEVKLKNNWKIELSENYRAPSFQIQRKRQANYYINLGIIKKFKNKRGSISISVRDLFNSREFIHSLHTSSFEVENSYKWQTRQVTIGLKYTIIDIK